MGDVIATTGSVLSPETLSATDCVDVGATVTAAVYVTVIIAEDVFPALSVAATAIVFVPTLREIWEMDHDVVPEAVPLVLFAAFAQVTVDTPTLSPAVPERLTVPEVVVYAPLLEGEAMAMAGAWESVTGTVTAGVVVSSTA